VGDQVSQLAWHELYVETQWATDGRVSAVIRRGMIVVGDPELAGAIGSTSAATIAAMGEDDGGGGGAWVMGGTRSRA
jgi:hypothetical protein